VSVVSPMLDGLGRSLRRVQEAGMDGVRVARRSTVAVAAVATQICLGAVYGWSVFVNPAS